MIKFLKNSIKKFTLQTPKLLDGIKNKIDLNEPTIIFKSFGNLNKDKTFYVIKRSPGTGLFSNVTFILNHLRICKKNNFIPIIDMDNFKTIYNENRKIKNTNNAWEYYFEKLNDYSLDEIYQSQNVFITSDKFFHFFSYDMYLDKELTKILQNQITIKKNLFKIFKKISKPFNHQKILGIHFRGTSYKRSPGHPFPATKKQMFEITKKILAKEKVDKIFLVTEEKNYLNFFKKKFPDKIINITCCYRSDKNDAFEKYPRNLHRYKLGREAILETLLLSKCDYFIYLSSNVSSAALSFNLNNNQKRIEIKNGMNSKNILVSQFLWYIKSILPKNLGGI
ncbi:hypothetical protein OA418_03675 [Candidatus Pelagibacter sp.]|nr:hypothetical protein [Candidatus Pelagibacter sp.]